MTSTHAPSAVPRVRLVRVLCTALVVAWLAVAASPTVQGLPATVGEPPSTEYARIGFALRDAPQLADLAGRAAALATPMHLTTTNPDAYWVVPAAGHPRQVRTARFYLLGDAATGPTGATLRLEVYGPDGTLRRTVSQSSVDLGATASGAWVALPLSAADADRLVGTSELLAVRVEYAGTGSVDLQPLFEITLEPPYAVHLPLIMRQAGF
ncbi:MAG: hypothetical protein ACYC4R_05350 [Anaerolineae bacterium]